MLRLRAELAFDVNLSQSLAELLVRRVDAALPARLDFSLTTEPPVEEGEVFVNERLWRR